MPDANGAPPRVTGRCGGAFVAVERPRFCASCAVDDGAGASLEGSPASAAVATGAARPELQYVKLARDRTKPAGGAAVGAGAGACAGASDAAPGRFV